MKKVLFAVFIALASGPVVVENVMAMQGQQVVPSCVMCGKPCWFDSSINQYSATCSNTCKNSLRQQAVAPRQQAPQCAICGKPCWFDSSINQYSATCSNTCKNSLRQQAVALRQQAPQQYQPQQVPQQYQQQGSQYMPPQFQQQWPQQVPQQYPQQYVPQQQYPQVQQQQFQQQWPQCKVCPNLCRYSQSRGQFLPYCSVGCYWDDNGDDISDQDLYK